MTSTFSFSDDGSDPVQPSAGRSDENVPSWLPKEAAGKYLQAMVIGISEAEHTFPNGPRKFMKLDLRVRWNAITYRQQMALWSRKGAIPLLRAIGIKTISVDTDEALNKPFTIKFMANQKGYLNVHEVLPEDHQSQPEKAAPGKAPAKPASFSDDEVPF